MGRAPAESAGSSSAAAPTATVGVSLPGFLLAGALRGVWCLAGRCLAGRRLGEGRLARRGLAGRPLAGWHFPPGQGGQIVDHLGDEGHLGLAQRPDERAAVEHAQGLLQRVKHRLEAQQPGAGAQRVKPPAQLVADLLRGGVVLQSSEQLARVVNLAPERGDEVRASAAHPASRAVHFSGRTARHVPPGRTTSGAGEASSQARGRARRTMRP